MQDGIGSTIAPEPTTELGVTIVGWPDPFPRIVTGGGSKLIGVFSTLPTGVGVDAEELMLSIEPRFWLETGIGRRFNVPLPVLSSLRRRL